MAPARDTSLAVDDEAITLNGHVIPSAHAFFAWPLLSPLLVPNESSDVRDHCANERTFLSYVRLAIYMAVVSVAVTLSFHLRVRPSMLERRVAKPLGLTFWALAVLTLAMGLANYIRVVNKYRRKEAIVQTGWRTQTILAIDAVCIIATCVILLATAKVQAKDEYTM